MPLKRFNWRVNAAAAGRVDGERARLDAIARIGSHPVSVRQRSCVPSVLLRGPTVGLRLGATVWPGVATRRRGNTASRRRCPLQRSSKTRSAGVRRSLQLIDAPLALETNRAKQGRCAQISRLQAIRERDGRCLRKESVQPSSRCVLGDRATDGSKRIAALGAGAEHYRFLAYLSHQMQDRPRGTAQSQSVAPSLLRRSVAPCNR